jgi:diaminohydroxyphosphoribosylaminopyrimidine deaminase/5-amino-6-(5-phosphoribosylamino)uracil reductase
VLTSRGANPARAEALRAEGVEVLSGSSLAERLEMLVSRGIRSLLVEGGARLAGSLLERGMVDRLVVFSAPMVIGAGSLNAFGFVSGRRLEHALRFSVQSRKVLGDDLMTTLVPEKR